MAQAPVLSLMLTWTFFPGQWTEIIHCFPLGPLRDAEGLEALERPKRAEPMCKSSL